MKLLPTFFQGLRLPWRDGSKAWAQWGLVAAPEIPPTFSQRPYGTHPVLNVFPGTEVPGYFPAAPPGQKPPPPTQRCVKLGTEVPGYDQLPRRAKAGFARAVLEKTGKASAP
jgi:hypothetical protein